MTDEELEHELEHVRQWTRLGWAFPIAYLVSSMTARRAGKSWYHDNRYECEARDAAKRIAQRRGGGPT